MRRNSVCVVECSRFVLLTHCSEARGQQTAALQCVNVTLSERYRLAVTAFAARRLKVYHTL